MPHPQDYSELSKGKKPSSFRAVLITPKVMLGQVLVP